MTTPTPHPDEDALYTLPPPQPVFYIEQALLGALLLQPQRLSDVTGISPDAFSSAAHAALFTAIRSMPTPDPAQHAKSTQWLDSVLTAAGEHTRGLTASYLHGLIQVCPWPRHASAYARMIEAEHARRLLRAAAQRLAHTARDTSLPHPASTALAEAHALTAIVDDIAAKFPPHSPSPPRTPTPPPTTAHNDEEAIDEERLLLATATAHPDDIEHMRWLTPDDFTHPAHAGIWHCLTALARRHAPIDPVTVLWEAQQRGHLTPGTDPTDLLDLLGAPVGSPEHWGERMLQRSLLATAHHTGHRIEAFTDDPATTPYQLVVGSRRALANLSAIRSRWHHATAPEPTTRHAPARATATPRAGPPRITAQPATRVSR
ncbi:DnaB-like helicase N-terminal domain-containing protein [Streptomyces sp. Inha503]|uniref:DnaB-like helicase N-terminal domain-containing protein n=1 Tax=Streptomyces sp. Inha503 TaxID=3383314 RepID=UPI0039A1F9FD